MSQTEKYEFKTLAKIAKFDKSFFENGYPLYGKDAEPLKIRCAIQTGSCIRSRVIIWDTPAPGIFDLDETELAVLWAACGDPDGQDNLLTRWSECSDKEFVFICQAQVWSARIQKPTKHDVQIYINAIVP